MRTISFTLNGKPTRLQVDEQRPLLWVLRDDLGMTGTKFGCGIRMCGACTVVVDNEAVRSCGTPVGEVEGKRVTTIEGLAANGRLHPVQEAFVTHGGFQCGYCTPGMIMSAVNLLQQTPKPTEQQIREGITGNFCRCTGYQHIVNAVKHAAEKGRA